MKIKNLICSYSFWTALAGALAILGSAIGKAFSVDIEGQTIADIVMSVASVLVAVGIISLPKKQTQTSDQDKNNQKDEQK